MSSSGTSPGAPAAPPVSRDSIGNILRVSILLCLVGAVAVSVAAVGLKARQDENKRLDMQRNVLLASGAYDDPEALTNDAVAAEFEKNVEVRYVDLETDAAVPASALPGGPDYDPKAAAGDAKQQVDIDPERNIAGIGTRARYYPVYFVKKDGKLDSVVLPIVGKGLWSTMYGFLALEPDLVTVRGINYYEHAETPGLGGEVDNPSWKKQWTGKQAFEDGEPAIRVVKGGAKGDNQVDGLSGATITSLGVQNTVNYWLGEDGFGKFLEKQRQAGARSAAAGGREPRAKG